MNGIIGMTELALDTNLAPDQREYLNMVKASADSLLEVINDILDFSKIEAGKLDLDTVDFPLRDSLGDTMKTLALRAHKKGLELACHVLPEVSDALVGDPGRLRQIIVNLVGNAIKFTDQGEVVVEVVPKACTATEAELHFTVRDTGIGIPQDKLQAIFAPFVQADGTTTRKYGGTGLGLAISSSLVDMMGGRIWVESTLGKGSTFHFTARFSRQQAGKQEPPASGPVHLENLPVLVVDDNATNRWILAEMLTNWHMKPTVVDSGRAALTEMDQAARAGKPFGLVLLDAMMPEMDGFTLAEKIKQQPSLAPATIMMLSSADRQTNATRGQQLGIAAYLMKPIKQSELFDAIMTTLGVAARREDSARADTPAPARARKLKVLLAEDNTVNQKLVIRLLERHGHDVTVAFNGREAFDAVKAERFDVVLMDVQMPEMDGLEATAAIRAHEQSNGKHVRIIAMTAHAMKGDRERCLEAGMDSYLPKPIQASDLYAALDGVAAVVPASADPQTEAPDFAKAQSRLGGDRELLKELVGVFIEEWPKWRKELAEAASAADATRLKRFAHTVKGSMGQFEAARAFELAQRLEGLAKEGRLEGFADANKALEVEIERILPAFLALAQGH
jgi:CheY-like chemotaxis protein